VLNRAEGGFGSYGRGAGQLFEPNGIGVDQRSGDVFVVDSNNARIDRFTSSGLFLFAWGWGITDKHKSLASSLVAERCSHRCFLGLEGPGAGQFQFPEGVAVDNSRTSPSRGDLWVVDIGNHRIEKFNADGRFLLEIGNGVNDVTHQQGYPSVENRCPVNAGDICGPGSEAPSKGPGQLEFVVEGDFIAVGPGGTLYVGQRNSVKEFTTQGRYKTTVELTPLPEREKSREVGGVSALAVDKTGNIYVVRHGVSGVREYSPSGKPLRTLEPGLGPAHPEGPTPALAIDTNNALFVDVHMETQHRIDEYGPNGAKVASFDQNQPDGLHGLAYSQPNHKLYIINTGTGRNPYQAHIRTTTPPH
jgi:tripartite motif-containing protein 71